MMNQKKIKEHQRLSHDSQFQSEPIFLSPHNLTLSPYK